MRCFRLSWCFTGVHLSDSADSEKNECICKKYFSGCFHLSLQEKIAWIAQCFSAYLALLGFHCIKRHFISFHAAPLESYETNQTLSSKYQIFQGLNNIAYDPNPKLSLELHTSLFSNWKLIELIISQQSDFKYILSEIPQHPCMDRRCAHEQSSRIQCLLRMNESMSLISSLLQTSSSSSSCSSSVISADRMSHLSRRISSDITAHDFGNCCPFCVVT